MALWHMQGTCAPDATLPIADPHNKKINHNTHFHDLLIKQK